MSTINKLSIRGIRSFGCEKQDEQVRKIKKHKILCWLTKQVFESKTKKKHSLLSLSFGFQVKSCYRLHTDNFTQNRCTYFRKSHSLRHLHWLLVRMVVERQPSSKVWSMLWLARCRLVPTKAKRSFMILKFSKRHLLWAKLNYKYVDYPFWLKDH